MSLTQTQNRRRRLRHGGAASVVELRRRRQQRRRQQRRHQRRLVDGNDRRRHGIRRQCGGPLWRRGRARSAVPHAHQTAGGGRTAQSRRPLGAGGSGDVQEAAGQRLRRRFRRVNSVFFYGVFVLFIFANNWTVFSFLFEETNREPSPAVSMALM